MNAVIMMLFGGGIGVGVLLVANALRPTSQPIGEVFDAVSDPGQGYLSANADAPRGFRDVVSSLGSAVATSMQDEAQLRKDLAVTGSSLEQHGLVKASWPAGAVLVVYLLWMVLAAVGLVINPGVAVVVALLAALIALIIPDARLRSRAKQRRIAFRHALSAYLDLVTVIMSGGGGLLTALQTSAEAGDGWAFAEIRASLDRARLSNRTPWSQLAILSDEFDIPELRDLVATAELAGSEGSRITQSVTTKADVLRSRLQSEVEETAESLTEQMLIPVGLLLVALFLFLGFAVFQQIGATNQPDINRDAIGMIQLRLLWGG